MSWFEQMVLAVDSDKQFVMIVYWLMAAPTSSISIRTLE